MALRRAAQARARSRAKPYAFPAPTRGWIANENLMLSGAAGALVLENFTPTSTGIRPRAGKERWATITGAAQSLFTYVSGPTKELFVSNETKIFEITTVVDPLVEPASAAVTGQTSGYYSTAQFTTSGGSFLYAVNGTDDPQLYNGTTWQAMNGASVPTLTGASGLAQVWKYRNRLFFVNGTMSAYYLAINAIGGALTAIPLSGVFQRGGSIMFGATWSLDAGDGIDDKCVFVTTEGEVAVFEGSDPSVSTDWNLVGRYDIPKPLGKNAFMSVGGDLLIEAEDGIVPISQVIEKDPAALSLSAVTRSIEPEWRREVLSRRTLPWEMKKWPTRTIAIISLPTTGTQDAYCFIVNLQTGAWAKYTGWDVRCLALHDDQIYFGGNDGKIFQAEVGGNDDGIPYVATFVGLPDQLGSPGAHKVFHAARSIFRTSTAVNPKVSASVNYKINLPSAPSSIPEFSVDEWDVGLWDVGLWDQSTATLAFSKWQSLGRSGYAISPQLQMTYGVTPPPRTELISIDILFENGGVMV